MAMLLDVMIMLMLFLLAILVILLVVLILKPEHEHRTDERRVRRNLSEIKKQVEREDN